MCTMLPPTRSLLSQRGLWVVRPAGPLSQSPCMGMCVLRCLARRLLSLSAGSLRALCKLQQAARPQHQLTEAKPAGTTSDQLAAAPPADTSVPRCHLWRAQLLMQQRRRQCLLNARCMRLWLPRWCTALHLACWAMLYSLGLSPGAYWLVLPGLPLLGEWGLREAVR